MALDPHVAPRRRAPTSAVHDASSGALGARVGATPAFEATRGPRSVGGGPALRADEGVAALRFSVPAGVTRSMARAFGVVWVLLALAALVGVVLLYGLESSEGIATFLSLGTEEGAGTWVAGMVHMLCALLAAGGALVARSGGSRWQRHWWLLAGTFVVLSFDEVAAVHDRLTSELSSAAGGTSGLLTYVWVVPALALGFVFLLVQVPFLRHLGRTGRNLVVAGAIFVAGAAGMEMVEGLVATADQEDSATYALLVTAEELLELGGAMLAAVVLAGHLVRALGEPQVTVRPRSSPRAPEDAGSLIGG